MMTLFKIRYVSSDWRLFIDGSTKSLKAVLLHNGNHFPSVPIAYGLLKETVDVIECMMANIRYQDHNWKVCCDLKMVNILLGLTRGWPKNACFHCLWDSRDKNHWEKRHWPLRTEFIVGKNNIERPSLVDPKNVIFPALHIKLGIMKQFVGTLKPESPVLAQLKAIFPRLSEQKIRAGVFDGPQIRKLMKTDDFAASLEPEWRNAWDSFKFVCNNFLGNHRCNDYQERIEEMLMSFRAIGARMSTKLHFVYSHLDLFPENCGDYSEEHGERFHQELKMMESRYRGHECSPAMLADYCWNLLQESPEEITKRNSFKTY